MVIDDILKISAIAPGRHPYNVLSKLVEEVGELAKEVNIEEGFIPQPRGKDGIIGECADVINCTVDLLFLYYPDMTEEVFAQIMQAKLDKWRNYFQN